MKPAASVAGYGRRLGEFGPGNACRAFALRPREVVKLHARLVSRNKVR